MNIQFKPNPLYVFFGAMLLVATPQLFAQTIPACATTGSDADGDGWGWENNASCRVISDGNQNEATNDCIDTDGDGYGWNGTATCIIGVNEETTQAEPTLCVDTDGDGYGWDGTQTCLVVETVQEEPGDDLFCQFSTSDPDGDGLGYENGRSCTMNEEYFFDVPVGNSIVNPHSVAMGQAFTYQQTSDTSKGLYFSFEVTSFDPVTITINGVGSMYGEFRQRDRLWGFFSVYNSGSTVYCFPPGVYQFAMNRFLHERAGAFSFKVEQTATTPCATPAETYQKLFGETGGSEYAHRGIYSDQAHTLNGFDLNGDEQWSFVSDSAIREFLKGDDGLVYMYTGNETTGNSLYVFDPDNLATEEQRLLAQPPNSAPACESSNSCAATNVRIKPAGSTETEHQIGETLTGTITVGGDQPTYEMTLTETTALTFVNTGSASLEVTSAVETYRTYAFLTGTARNPSTRKVGQSNQSTTTTQSVCLPAGTYQLDLTRHHPEQASYFSFSVEQSDIQCIQPIHLGLPLPYFSDRFRADAVPMSDGVIYYSRAGHYAAIDWQGNEISQIPQDGWSTSGFGVTSDGVAHRPYGNREWDDVQVVSRTREGVEVARKSYPDSVDLFAAKNTVLVVPINGAIEAFDSTGTLLWLHSIPPENKGFDSYYYHLINSDMQLQ